MEDQLLRMGTLPRHNHLVSTFFGNIFPLFQKKKLYPLQENCFLALYGKKYSNDERLIDPNILSDISILEELDVIQPDFLLFQYNPYIQSPSTMRTAGIPDLVVEVWSKSNDQLERDMKFRIYSSHPDCEHWYVEQDSNIVKCFKGKDSLPNQNLKDMLRTSTGLEFDLTHLAL